MPPLGVIAQRTFGLPEKCCSSTSSVLSREPSSRCRLRGLRCPDRERFDGTDDVAAGIIRRDVDTDLRDYRKCRREAVPVVGQSCLNSSPSAALVQGTVADIVR